MGVGETGGKHCIAWVSAVSFAPGEDAQILRCAQNDGSWVNGIR